MKNSSCKNIGLGWRVLLSTFSQFVFLHSQCAGDASGAGLKLWIHLCIFCLSRVRGLREGQMRDRVPPECPGSTRPHSGGTCPGSRFSSFNCRGHSPLFQPVITVSETLIWRLICHSRNTSSSSQPEPFSKKRKKKKKAMLVYMDQTQLCYLAKF